MSDLISPYLKYDKISDDLYILGRNAVARFNVTLSKNIDNIRRHFHNEYEYPSKFSNSNNLITIRRSFDYYLSIENFKGDENKDKEFIMITVSEIMLLKFKLQEVVKWFTSSAYDSLYIKKNNKLIIPAEFGGLKISLSNLPMNKYIEFRPIVCEYDNGDSTPGVRMYLNSEDNYVDMPVDKLMGFYYTIDNLNMYESAQLMINYLQRPELGTNLYSFSGSRMENATSSAVYEETTAKSGRQIPKRKLSLDDL